jgi:hypothetical protein
MRGWLLEQSKRLTVTQAHEYDPHSLCRLFFFFFFSFLQVLLWDCNPEKMLLAPFLEWLGPYVT